MATPPHAMPRADKPQWVKAHERAMTDIRTHLGTNANQIAVLIEQTQKTSDQVQKTSEQVSRLTTTVEVIQVNLANHAEDVKGIRADVNAIMDRERTKANISLANAFTLGNNAVGWIVLVIATILGVLSGHIK